MAGSAARFVLGCSVFHADIHSACSAKRNRAESPDLVVQPAVPSHSIWQKTPVSLAVRSAWWVSYIPGGAIWLTTFTSITWFRQAAWQLVPIPGCLPGRSSCCQSRRSRKSSAASSGRHSTRQLSSRRFPPRSGSRIGWWSVKNTGPAKRGAMGVQLCNTWLPMSFAWPSATAAWSSAENGQVTFRYRATDTGQPKLCTLSAEAFIPRFLQHVLPKGFVKVRFFGFFAPDCRKRLLALRQQLEHVFPENIGQSETAPEDATPVPKLYCPSCGPHLLF